MVSKHRVISNLYRESVSLMQVSSTLASREGVQEAYAVMATPANLDPLRDAGVDVGAISAGPNDVVIVIEGEDEGAVQEGLAAAEEVLFREEAPVAEGVAERPPRSILLAVRDLPEANLALISTPGEYAAAEALKALQAGLHVMIFSDNVSLDDEIAIKERAHGWGLLAMGPDCGTAIINGVPLGFANVVRRGSIGAIGASGTGLQQVTSLVDRWGQGISQAIGTGSHDLHSRVGAITMLDALDALAADEETEVIVLISKPPAAEVARRVLERARAANKPVVVEFIGAEDAEAPGEGLTMVHTLDEAAARAVALAGGEAPEALAELPLEAGAPRFAEGQRYLRGLFSGGTFAYEATLLLEEALGTVYSNTPTNPAHTLDDPWKSREHTTVDLGDDEFTRGRPHPMIDYRLRVERLIEEARDPAVAVVLLDVVLGHGAHEDPAGELVPAIGKAPRIAREAGRELAIVASVCGTERDPQGLARQERALQEAGVILGRSNAHAARIAAHILQSAGGQREAGR